MDNISLYEDIKARTGGEIYPGGCRACQNG